MGYPTCILSTIINPGKYSVVSTDKEHVSEVLDLEEKMKKEMLYDDTSEFELSVQMCVAVMNKEGTFRRGVIEKKLESDFYEVLLIDSGFTVNIEKSKIKVITNQDFMKVEPLGFIVKLYGIIPVQYVSMGEIKKPRALQHWSAESEVFIQNLLQCNCNIVVQSILIQQRIVYGDLFVQLHPKEKFVSLRKLLCRKEFCVYSEKNFLRQECLVQPNEYADLDNKMELVEKWRRENFVTQKNSFRLPSPGPICSSVKTDFSFSCSTSNSISESPIEPNNPSDSKTVPAVRSEEHKRLLGTGRGKLKRLISEMKKNQIASGADKESSCQIDSPNRLETKVTLGRGQLLKKYLEIKKSLKSNCETPLGSGSCTETDFGKTTTDRSSLSEAKSKQEINLPKEVFKMKKAVVKSGEFCELSESTEMTEVSLSTEEEPPSLVRNVTVGKNFNRKKLTSVKSCGRDSNKSDFDVKPKSVDVSIDSRNVETCPTEKEVNLGSTRNCWGDENCLNPSTNREMLKCYWTPYVLFDDCVIEEVKSFRELRIQPSIIKNLERGGSFESLSQVQRWMIPSIRRQLSTVVIGSSRTGKTLGYVVPLMDYIQDESYFEELPQGNGPSLVILASSSRTCESIYNLCCSLIGRTKVRIVLAHCGNREKEAWIKLTNGCDVLISTPNCLVRLLEMPVVTNFERLTCLVLDEFDVISKHPFQKNVGVILEKARLSTENRHYQKIVCGKKWTSDVESLVKTYVGSHTLVIGSHAEAVIYEGLKPRIYIVDKSEKENVLLEKLKDLEKLRVLIACESTSDAVILNDFLAERGIFSVLAHDNIMADQLKDVREIWKSPRSPVLVATDGVLNELNIREAQALIHYSLPCNSKTNFYLRYFTLEGFLRDKQRFSRTKSKNLNKELHDIILMDEESHYQLPHIVDFVKRLKGKLPANVLVKCQEIQRLLEVQKRNTPICDNLLSLGYCWNFKDCPRRHVFVKAWDSPGSLPTAGWVNFVVLRVHDASFFSIRLVESIDADGKRSKWDDPHLDVLGKLSEFYKKENERRPHGTLKVGDVCAVHHEEVFYRAKVIEHSKSDKHGKPLEVIVRLMDRGDVLSRKAIQLYELPEELSKYPPVAVDARMVGLQPLDFDPSWSRKANEFTEKLMSENLEENQYWSGRIVLSLKDTLFLDPIQRKRFLPHLNTRVFDLVVSTELLNNQVAVVNNQHLQTLTKLFLEGDLEVPKVEEARKEEPKVIHPQWAFFDEDFIRVRFLAAESTSTVFLQPKKFHKLLLKLEDDCQKEGAEESVRAKAVGTVGVGTFCLALFEDGKWNRARIESEKEDQYYVYFVDHGDFFSVAKSDVVPISESLLLRLPCQAIECKLAGVQEMEECPIEILQEIYDFSENGKEDLYAYITRKDLTANITNGRKYSLNLLNRRGISLNKMLVDCEIVRAEESERSCLEDVQVNASDDETDNEEVVEDVEEEEEKKEEEEEEEASEKSPGTNLFVNYFEGLNEDTFEEDGAKEFLKEFASTFFNVPEPPRHQSGEIVEEVKKDVGHISPSKDASGGAKTVRTTSDTPAEKDGKEEIRELELKGRENVLTPQVHWCQNQLDLQIKILLGNVEDYSLECTVSNFSFRCFSGDKFYAVDLRLFGGINPELTNVTLRTFHVSVVLTKLAYPLWPRLHLDEGKLRWINLDVESLCVKDGVFSDRIRSAKLEIESGVLKKGIRCETIYPCSDSGDSDNRWTTNSDSEDSDDLN